MTRTRAGADELEITRRDPAVVLVAHPDEGARTLLVENLLFFTNHRVVEAQGGPEAIERARRHRPRVVVLSATLPGMSWPDVVRALKGDPATREARLIVLAADDAAAEQARGAPGVEVVAAPELARELIQRVRRAASRPTAPSVRRAGEVGGVAPRLAARAK